MRCPTVPCLSDLGEGPGAPGWPDEVGRLSGKSSPTSNTRNARSDSEVKARKSTPGGAVPRRFRLKGRPGRWVDSAPDDIDGAPGTRSRTGAIGALASRSG